MSEKYVLERPDDREYGNAEYTVMSVGDNFVSLAHTYKKTGETKTGKTWTRYPTRDVLIFKTGHYPDGRPKVNVYRKVNPSQGRNREASFRNVTPQPAQGSALFRDQYSTIAIGQFLTVHSRIHGTTVPLPTTRALAETAYPILALNPRWTYMRGLGPALRHATPRAFVETAFGKTRYRKDLLKAIAGSSNLFMTAATAQLRGFIPVDWMVDAIRDGDKPGANFARTFRMRALEGITDFRALGPLTDDRSLKRLLNETASGDANAQRWMDDTFRSLHTLKQRNLEIEPLGKVSGWQSLHDQLARAVRMATTKNQPIRPHKMYKTLDGQLVGGYTLSAAPDTWTLEDWGTQMSNCIASYAEQAVRHQTFLFGVYKDGELVANMEVSRQGKVRQLHARFNGYFPDHDAVVTRVHELTGQAKVAEIAYDFDGFGQRMVDFGQDVNVAADRFAEAAQLLNAGVIDAMPAHLELEPLDF